MTDKEAIKKAEELAVELFEHFRPAAVLEILRQGCWLAEFKHNEQEKERRRAEAILPYDKE